MEGESDGQAVVVCVAYGGEGYKSRLQVTRCQGGWPKGLESGFGLCHGDYTYTYTVQRTRRRSDLRGLHDSHVSGQMAISHLVGHSQRRFVRGRGLDGE